MSQQIRGQGGHLSPIIPKNTNLVEDVEFLLPVRLRSNLVEDVEFLLPVRFR